MRYVTLLGAFLLGAEAATPTYSYAPYFTNCPTGVQLVRKNAGMSEAEKYWTSGRKPVAAQAFASYLTRLNLTGFDLSTYTSKITQDPATNMPVIAWANSGGAWRSSLTGAGGLRAIDAQTPGANESGTGGLLQSLTYIAGLSGGSWPTIGYTLGDYVSIDEMVANWHVNINRFTATTYSEYAAPASAYLEEVAAKAAGGFNISASDFLAQGFGYEFIPGDNITFSSLVDMPGFKNFSGPMPMLLASSINSSSPVEEGLYVPTNMSRIYEWNPFEFGSWDEGWILTQYVGTVPNMNGTAEQCVVNYDQASFVSASVASAYNYWYIAAVSNGSLGQFSKRSAGDLEKRQVNLATGIVDNFDELFNETFGLSVSQIANPSIPNPFGGSENITLADGSEAGQSIPFWGLIQPDRNVDLIMAWDDDGDGNPYNWNNGTNIWDTYNLAKAAGLPFPMVPPPSTMLARNYTLKPTLYGCNSSLTTTGNSSSPIVAYFTNAPYSWYSNYSGFTMNMSYVEYDGILVNSFNFVTQGNGTIQGRSDWATCLGCAAIDRSLERMGMDRTDECEQCFSEWCWDGTFSELPSDYVFDPSLQLDPSLGYAVWN